MPLTGDYAPSTSAWARDHAERYEASGGTDGNHLRGRPIVVLTSVGARTGKLRKTALMRVEHEGRYAVVASLGGAPRHPLWYHNLKANPHVELQDGPIKRDYLARELSGEEKAAWWERAVEAFPDYAAYQAKTDRQIPVFVLEPMEGQRLAPLAGDDLHVAQPSATERPMPRRDSRVTQFPAPKRPAVGAGHPFSGR
jgi:deazaflavin-dependent oxidoreductase (nitroreductase family)